MIKYLGFIAFALFLETGIFAQEQTTPAESRKKQLTTQLNYRFKGGLYTFEKLFNSTVTYPEAARRYCIQGIVIVSFDVTCDGQLGFVTIKNPLHYGIDEEVKKFFVATNGKWNKCHDKKYEHFNIPIQFKIKGTQSLTREGLIIFEGKNPGFICNGEEYYLQKAKKYLEKGKGKKATEYLDILIRLDPFNSSYYKMKEEAITAGGKKKKKK